MFLLVAATTLTSTLTSAVPPGRGESLFEEHPDDLALGAQRHVGDLVQQQRTAVRPLERARVPLPPVAALGAEQFGLHAIGRDRRAVERHERSSGAARPGVDHPRGEFLAGSGRAGDQHPAVGPRHPVDRAAQLGGRRRNADELPFRRLARAQGGIGARPPRRVHRPPDGARDLGAPQRLLYEIDGAEPHRFDGGLDLPVAADRHDRNLGAAFAQGLQHRQPVPVVAAQPDVENHDLRRPLLDRPQGGGAVARLPAEETLFDEHVAEERPDVRFVVDYQYLALHGRPFPNRLRRSARGPPARGLP